MMSSLSIALSGLTASTRQLAASASNIANSRTTGPRASQPIQTVQQSLAGPGQAGGVIASDQPIDPSTVQEYDPSAPGANADGMVAAPNVDPIAETVAQMTALDSYELNLQVLEKSDRMLEDGIDIKA